MTSFFQDKNRRTKTYLAKKASREVMSICIICKKYKFTSEVTISKLCSLSIFRRVHVALLCGQVEGLVSP